jgi:hypothetical protein
MHPAPYQAMALGRQGDDVVIVISEPPPSLGRAELIAAVREAFGDSLREIGYYRVPTGLDGWLEDLVLRVGSAGEPDVQVISGQSMQPWSVPLAVADRMRLLHALLYATTDGFWLDDINRDSPSVAIDELRVPPSSLQRWLANSTLVWQPLDAASAPMPNARLNAASEPGAYARSDGLVALVLPQRADLATVEPIFRRFAVASDLLLGAARRGARGPLVLLARARRLPLSVLPPLRFETFASLARNTNDELAQSYERRRIFAGKIRSGEHQGLDWAPILLSAQLDDSEFGTLLNQADQMLKSWSQHGDVHYYAFNDDDFHYPTPSTFPFVDQAASDYFAQRYGTASLLFNWNTENLGAIVEFPDQEILAVDRTAALPILYVPANVLIDPADDSAAEPSAAAARALEQRAQSDAAAWAIRGRDYFARLGEPVLVRVVQNVTMAQALRSFFTPPQEAVQTRVARSERVAAAMQREAAAWIEQVISGGVRVPPPARAQIDALRTGRSNSELAELIAFPQRADQRLIRERRQYMRLRARAEEAARDFMAMGTGASVPAELRNIDAQIETARARVRARCQVLHGTFTLPGGRARCSYSLPANLPEDAQVRQRLDEVDGLIGRRNVRAGEIVDEARQRVGRAIIASNHQLSVHNATVDLINRIAALGETLQGSSGGADLDHVLRTAVQAGGSVPSEGSIRTPSVVLSRHGLQPESIGGHNIGLIVPRARVSNAVRLPRRVPEGAVEAEAPLTQSDAAVAIMRGNPAAAAPPAPLAPGEGTLLARMRAAAQGEAGRVARGEAAGQASRTAVMQAAAECRCDVLVRRFGDDSILMVRTGPPQSVQQVPMKSGLIEALAGPPRPGRVEFQDFPRASVDSIRDTLDRMASGASGRGGGRGRNIAGLFERGSSGEGRSTILLGGPNRRAEVLEVSDASARTALRSMVNPRGAADFATPEAWRARFGNAGLDGEGTRIIVDFPLLPNGNVRGIGVRILNAAGDMPTRILARIRVWMGARPAASTPLEQTILALRQEIRGELSGGADVDFYFGETSQVIRVAETGTGASVGG